MTELVALYDPADPVGRVTGSAPRDRVRAENLPHAATAVLLRRRDGRVFVHRRSDAKDVWPGRHDCTAGGVIVVGEEPDAGALRELAEELGVTSAVLRPLLRRWYRDEDTWYLAFVYTAVWDGEVRFADGEVSDGWWEDPRMLYARLDDAGRPFVPDARELLGLETVRSLLLDDELS